MLDTVQEATPSLKERSEVLMMDLAEVRPTALAAKPAGSPAIVKGDAAASLLKVIAAAARDPQVDIEKMERLVAMHDRLVSRAAEQAFNEAMTAAQAEMSPISADADNTATKSKYATYAKLDRVLRPIYTKHGFAISFDNGDGAPENYVRVLAYVSRGAFTRTYHADIPADGKGAKGGDVMTKTHATGSANTYGMRYLLKMIFNVAVGEKDDDGNGAGGIGPGAITEKIFDGLIDDLRKTTTDDAAAALWASGSKSLAATECREAYADFKKAVVSHRNALKGAAK
jgi:hypothetical protein